MISQSTLADYLDALASKAAAPGGGAAAGVTGAEACALMEMVCRLTRDNEQSIARILSDAEHAREKFVALAQEDMEKFEAVMAAFRLPDTERNQRLQPALEEAAKVPLAMIEVAVGLIEGIEQLAAIGNPNLITDTGIAALLVEATIRSSRLNVMINLRSITDESFNAQANAKLSEALGRLPALAVANAAVEAAIAPTVKETPSSPSAD